MDRIILFLIRRKLKVGKFEKFRFANQHEGNDDIYNFNSHCLMKKETGRGWTQSGVSLNYLLSDECEIVRLK